MNTLVTENFGGSGSLLDGTGADSFAAAITAAGGSGTWAAGANFLDNGVISVESNNRSAYLNLGSYINATKGTAAGKFELVMTVSPTTGAWISLGFAAENSPNIAKNFTNVVVGTGANTTGLGTIIYRATSNPGELDMFGGPTNLTGVVDGPDGSTGNRSLTVTLDLTTAGGYNGSSNFGKVTWSDSVLGALGNYTFPSTQNFGSILISESASSGGTISALALKQVAVELPPAIVSTSPADNSINVAISANLTATFTEAIQRGTGTVSIWKTAGNELVQSLEVATSSRITLTGDQLVIDPTSNLLAGIAYHVLIDSTAIRDLAGNPFVGISTSSGWNFTTDNTPPVASDTSPAPGAISISSAADLALSFGENVSVGTGLITIHRASDGSVVETIDVTEPGAVVISGATVLIPRSGVLEGNTAYYVNITAGAFRDLSGNAFAGISGPAAWTFITWAGTSLVEEYFSGSGASLNGTTAESFSPAVTAAGGAPNWSAGASFRADGVVTTDPTQNSASLNLGSFITAAAGSTNARFTLTLALSETSGEWISLGFASENSPGTGRAFTNSGSGDSTTGLATILYRSQTSTPAGELEIYGGPRSDNSFDGPDANTGYRTLSVTLDLTPDSGYNGSNNCGTVTWADSVSGVLGGYTYATPQTFGSILISKPASSGGTLHSLSLRQEIPGAGNPFILAITPSGSHIDLTWPSQPGRVYDLLSSGDLTAPIDTWPVYGELADIPSSGASTTVTEVPKSDPKRFFAVRERDQRPNIVLIMADDLGYGSLGCYGATGSQVSTPAIDSLAATGVRLTDFHSNGAVCSPTRAALMTGRYQQRCAWVPDSDLSPIFRSQRLDNIGQRWAWGMSLQEITVAELLQPAGYRTGMFGKSHLGYDLQFHPINQGFETYRGFMGGELDYHTHIAQYGFQTLDWWNGRKLQNDTGYTTDLLTTYATAFINAHQDEPFFLYVPHAAPHTPLQVRDPNSTKSNIARYREMIETLDESVATIIATLQANGLREKTLLIFCSDNGPQTTYGSWPTAGPFTGLKNTLLEGGHRVPCIVSWPGQIPQNVSVAAPVMSMDFLPTFTTLAAATLPPGHQIDGTDLLPLLRGEDDGQQRVLHWEVDGNWVVRRGKWKLTNGTKLVDLSVDPSEATNLAAANPALVSELTALHNAWFDQMPVVPAP
jgi:arylsulfatase A-like enzyme/methionine-rich copper-binding protein CopC